MNLFSAMANYYSSWSTSRQLDEMDAHRLNDLGLNRYDLFDARRLNSHARSALYNSRRSERANSWLR